MRKLTFYLKFLMGMLLFAFIAPPAAHAESLTVAGDEETSHPDVAFIPVYGQYMDTDGTLSQTIYSKNLLSDLAGNQITQITYYADRALSGVAGVNVEIFLLETDTEEFTTATALTGFSTANGTCTISATDQGLVFNLAEPFTYSGSKNLAIQVKVNGSLSDKYGTIYWKGEGTSKDVSYYYYKGWTEQKNKSSFMPKTTFTYESAGVSVDPTSLSFGGDSFYFGNTEEKNVTVNNSTDAAVAVSIDGDNADQFEIKNNVTSVAAGTTNGTITVVYKPTAAGTHTATLHVGNKTVALSGQAVTPPTPTIAVNPTTLNFGTVGVNSSKTQTFTVNGSNLTSDITLTASGDYFSVSPTTIAKDAASDVIVTVTYAPTAAGTHTGSVRLTSTDADTKTVILRAVAEAVNYNGTVETENGALSLDFGTVNIGQTSEKLQIKVTNTGNAAFSPVFSIDNPVFSIENTREIATGTSQYFELTFKPAAAGRITGTLTVTIGEQTFRVSLTGVGHEVPAYDITSSAASGVHNYGDVFVNEHATWSFTLSNNGKNSVTPTITGLAAPFTTTYTPAALVSGDKVTITIDFAPTALQAYGPQSIVVKFNETEDFQFDYTLRGKGVKNTGTKPASFYEGIEYTWTDKDGNEKTSNLGEIATDPNQMIALLKEVYTNKNVPGNLHRGYNANGTATTGDVAYPAIGGIQRNYDSETRTYTHDFYDAYGWGMYHDEDNYPMTQQSVPSTTYTITDYIMNPNEYKPNQEGVTLLLVEMNDGVQYNSWSTRPGNYGQLRNLFAKMFKSVRVVTNSKLVEKKGEGNSTIPGTLFKVDCDKMNRFFFLAKGRLRHYAGQTGSSAYFRDQVKNSGSGSSYTWTDQEDTQATVNPFNVMYEQFSPVSLSSSQESSDVYQSLINMDSYLVEHDCESVPWASANDVIGHEFNMYGKASTSEDCQDVRDLMFFVPTKRMQAWSDRDKSTSDMYVNYYKPNAPTMGLYVIRQNEITGEKINDQDTYKLHLTWDSNLTDFVPSSEGAYFIYLVNEDGTYTKVGETNAQTKELYIDVNMAEHGQQVTYVIQGQDNTQFLSLQMSNEESFIIPGTNQNEKFQLLPNAEYYSRFNPADQYNYYANGLQIKNYPAGLNTNDLAGKKLIYYRQAKDQSVWDKVGEVTISGTTGSAEMFGQRAQTDYKYGYKTNPELVVSTSGSDYVFGTNEKPFIIFDNIKADVSLNIHADYYKYIVVVDGTPDQKDKIHSNAITIRVQKTAMSPIAGVFSKEAVDADTKHATGLVDKSFDVDVTYSSKTDVLRYDAYRWKDSEAIEIIDHTSDPDNEKDLAPQGIAGNQGEFYTVAMNSDYVGEDVYVTQGQTAQATFVDNVATDEAGAYTYAPVVETFTGRGDYNTYGGALQHSATGTIGVKVQTIDRNGESGQIEQSTYTWTKNGQRYAYYNVYLDVNSIEIPEGYDLYKVRAWRKIDPSLLAEELLDYQERMGNGDGECLFEEITSGTDAACKKTGITSYALGSVEKEDVSPVSGKPFKVWGGTFGAKILSQGDEMPMEFTVRAYFTRNENLTSGSSNAPRRAEGDATVTDANGYYITESTVKFTATGSDIITAVTDKSINREVKDVIYYNMTGAVSVRPFDGVNVVVTRYTDGTTSTRKMIK